MHYETAQLTVAYRNRCEDRVDVIHEDERPVIAVADGAGGIGGGDLASEAVIREVRAAHLHVSDADSWERELRQIDFRVGPGESTAVVVDVRPDSIAGASVGDSQAWIIQEGNLIDLTAQQNHKPLLGSGKAGATGFSAGPLKGILLVATDGFCSYTKRQRVIDLVVQSEEFLEIPRRCVELVRLPSGALWDDIGIVVCRVQPPRRPLRRHAL
jgi:serine/threonine protein phosphatase PrpC